MLRQPFPPSSGAIPPPQSSIQYPPQRHRGQSPPHSGFAHPSDRRRHQGSNIECHLQAQNGVGASVQQRGDDYDEQADGDDGKHEAGPRMMEMWGIGWGKAVAQGGGSNGREVFQWEGRAKIRAPTSNGRSDTNAPLAFEA
ncbi:uncharacterized protein ARMOST_02011 [Armillaria ostoyae]|uniref:Uncharacterized protein n=1 Tax=Armillaria ostoyae TaxID=47428 RepID=A0A284QQI9_ARMOS|nr:uncharacterized protein ARMOST_02011 [Armillaria ostoyae]